ncbi:hypothetical protein RCL_jg24705.t1 [Rhizophagus clarus]|uniref:Uncharacterized protein n=2 Tax=Rhizophagus clarus TaxID=94130 RepID=A0A8H3M5U3_9GLOM|nr:hypothetical protein RCL_jg24705.t1 [Rhizophagus clarus]
MDQQHNKHWDQHHNTMPIPYQELLTNVTNDLVDIKKELETLRTQIKSLKEKNTVLKQELKLTNNFMQIMIDEIGQTHLTNEQLYIQPTPNQTEQNIHALPYNKITQTNINTKEITKTPQYNPKTQTMHISPNRQLIITDCNSYADNEI